MVGVTTIVAFLPFLSILIASPPPSDESNKVQSVDYLHLMESYGGGSSSQSAIVSKRDDLPTTSTTTTTTISTSSNSSSSSSSINYQSITEKWQLPKAAIPLLKKIQSRPVGFDYNRTSDILALRHPLKTGGTSFSKMLKIMFKGQVLPGSAVSGWFERDKLNEALVKHPVDESSDFWRNMSVLYTHTMLRRMKGKKTSNLLGYYREQVPVLAEKRFRLMTIIRRPLDLAASSYYETKCRIGFFSGGRHVKEISECPKVNLTDVKIKNIEACRTKKKTHGCGGRRTDLDKHFEMCGSIDYLLESKKYVHNQHYQTLMGDLPQPPEFEQSKTPTMDEVALYTIRDMGGLIDFNEIHKEDFIWFAVTERMKESMCLFYYRMKIDPVPALHSL